MYISIISPESLHVVGQNLWDENIYLKVAENGNPSTSQTVLVTISELFRAMVLKLEELESHFCYWMKSAACHPDIALCFCHSVGLECDKVVLSWLARHRTGSEYCTVTCFTALSDLSPPSVLPFSTPDYWEGKIFLFPYISNCLGDGQLLPNRSDAFGSEGSTLLSCIF